MAIIINPKELSASAVFLFTDNMLLLWDNDTMLPDTECLQDFINAGVIDFYFYETGHDYICGSLNIDCKTIHTGEVVPLRTIFENQLFFAARAARAKAILSWKKSVLFCSYCGTRLVDAAEETACDCVQCGRRFYPSLSPAIIVQVVKGEELLLARHANRNTDVYTCLAGYVEPGETLEDCVRREIKEETAIEVKNVKYITDQSWPFPNQMMFGFTAEWDKGTIDIDKTEIEDAQWFRYDNLPKVPPPGTLAYHLIKKTQNEIKKSKDSMR